uniref:hypothetical protein n=1 Tax=Sandarakinorhabdus oryzae TaxID=2675220 RepID=UPI0012E16144
MPTVKFPLTLAGAGPNEALPVLALYALPDGKPAQKIAVAADGSLSFDPAKLKGMTLALGPDADPATLDSANLMRVRADQVLDGWARSGIIIPRERWWLLLTETLCVSGDVRKCRPWYLGPTYVKARALPTKLGVQVQPQVSSPFDLSASAIVLPIRCLPLCDGVVEIYERVCCCPTIDWHDLIDRLRDLLRDLPVLVQWPVPPIPDPGPLIPGRIPGGFPGGIPIPRPVIGAGLAARGRIAPRVSP